MIKIIDLPPGVDGYDYCLAGLPMHYHPESADVKQWVADTEIDCLYYGQYLYLNRAEDLTYAFLHFSRQEYA